MDPVAASQGGACQLRRIRPKSVRPAIHLHAFSCHDSQTIPRASVLDRRVIRQLRGAWNPKSASENAFLRGHHVLPPNRDLVSRQPQPPRPKPRRPPRSRKTSRSAPKPKLRSVVSRRVVSRRVVPTRPPPRLIATSAEIERPPLLTYDTVTIRPPEQAPGGTSYGLASPVHPSKTQVAEKPPLRGRNQGSR